MKSKANLSLGYAGPEWDKKSQDRNNPNFWKYGVANLIFLDLTKDRKKIIDIGCGTGGSTLFLAEHAQLDQIIGIDPVKSMIEVAKQHALSRSLNLKADFVICDGRHLPFKQSCFDALVSRGDAFVFLVPQKAALLEFKRVMRKGAVLVLEIDNVQWTPGKIISCGLEKLNNGAIAYSIEYFDAKRNHFKVFYILNPQSAIFKKICKNEEFVQTGRLKRRFPLKKIRKETIEIRRSVVTHWPSIDETKTLFSKAGFTNIEIFGDGLLMRLLLEGEQKVTKAMKEQPELFFEIERKFVRFVDPKKAYTMILKASVR